MKTATRKQQRILDFIIVWRDAEGVVPSYQEIADHFKLRSLNSVTKHVRFLRQKGLLEKNTGKARSLRVTSVLSKLRSRIVNIPLLGSIPAGRPENREQNAEGCVSVDVETIGFKNQSVRNAIALVVKGDSMIGRQIMDGDIAILERGADPRSGQIVAALVDGETTLKTFISKGGKTYLRAENIKYPNIIPSEELVIQGVLKALIRKSMD